MASAAVRTWRKPPFVRDARLRWALWVGAAVYLALALGTLEVNWGRVVEGVPRAHRFVAAFFPPDFTTRWDSILGGLLESVWMTVTSTVVGVAISIPIGLGAARNLAPTPAYLACRAIVGISRTFPEIILAIFFVKVFGFGPFAGFLALSIATVGFYAKLLVEDFEAMDPGPAGAAEREPRERGLDPGLPHPPRHPLHRDRE